MRVETAAAARTGGAFSLRSRTSAIVYRPVFLNGSEMSIRTSSQPTRKPIE